MLNPEMRPPMPEGWQNETGSLRNKIAEFLSQYYAADSARRPKYDVMNDLQLSGGSVKTMRAVRERLAKINEVTVLYDNGKPEQIHVVATVDEGSQVDFILKGQALKDFYQRFQPS